jgi:hypothetical protein
MRTNWRDFGIGMASGIAFCFVLYFGWGLIHPRPPETANSIATPNVSVGVDENALIAANAERPNNSVMTPPPQLRPEPRNQLVAVPEPRPEPPVVRPRPRPEPEDEPPPEDIGPDDDDGGKPQE